MRLSGLVVLTGFNLFTRNRGRTAMTILATAFAVVTFVLLRTVIGAYTVGANFAAKDRLATRHKISFVITLPKKYLEEIRQVPGVTQAAGVNWFGARDPNRPEQFFATLAVEPKDYTAVFDEMVLDKESMDRWQADKQGAIIGAALAKSMGWKVGDKVTLEGTIFPGDWEFHITGIYEASRKSLDRSQFLFHWSYLNDSLPPARQDQIGWINMRVNDPERGAAISAAIDKVFDERDTQTVTQSERAMNLSFLGMFSAILKALDIVSLIILGIMAMVLGNTIAMGVRERTREYAMLRAIGFQPWHVGLFIVSEALVLGAFSSLVGLALAYPVVEKGLGRWIEENMGGFFPYFRIDNATIGQAISLGIVLAVGAALIPARNATRLGVTDALRRVA